MSKRASSSSTKPTRSFFRRPSIIIIASAMVLSLLVVAGAWALHTSYFSVRHVTVSGDVHESRRAVLEASGLTRHPAMFGLDTGAVAQRVEALPWVRQAIVLEHWPNTVSIQIIERTVVAVAYGKKGALQLVDSTGAVVAPVTQPTNLPLLVAQGAKPGQAWPFTSWAAGAAHVAAVLPPAFSQQVAAVRIDRQGDVSFAMTSPITFELGPPVDLHDKFVAIAAVIANGTLNPGDVVDVSVPSTLSVSGP